jgi:hypothetical protein
VRVKLNARKLVNSYKHLYPSGRKTSPRRGSPQSASDRDRERDSREHKDRGASSGEERHNNGNGKEVGAQAKGDSASSNAPDAGRSKDAAAKPMESKSTPAIDTDKDSSAKLATSAKEPEGKAMGAQKDAPVQAPAKPIKPVTQIGTAKASTSKDKPKAAAKFQFGNGLMSQKAKDDASKGTDSQSKPEPGKQLESKAADVRAQDAPSDTGKAGSELGRGTSSRSSDTKASGAEGKDPQTPRSAAQERASTRSSNSPAPRHGGSASQSSSTRVTGQSTSKSVSSSSVSKAASSPRNDDIQRLVSVPLLSSYASQRGGLFRVNE